MPRIVKWSEKRQYIKPKLEPWQEDMKLKYLPIAEQAANAYRIGNLNRAYGIIENLINTLLPMATDEWFDEFVEVKNLSDYVSV